MKTTITFEIDTDDLTSFTDQHLADLWHVAQANPAPFGDRDACRVAEYIGREIIRRFLSNTAPNLWSHQGAHINAEAFVAEVAEVAEQAQTIRAPYTATATTCTCGAQDKDTCTDWCERTAGIAAIINEECHRAFIGTTNAADMQTSAPPAFPEGTTPVFLTGAQGAGKTTNAPAIAAALGCSEIIDGLDAIPPLAPGSKPLVISEPPTPLPKGAVVVQVADAEGIATLISGGVPGLSEASAKWQQEFAELRRLPQLCGLHTLRKAPSDAQSDPATRSGQIQATPPAERKEGCEAPHQGHQTSA